MERSKFTTEEARRVGKWIKSRRKQSGLSQPDLGVRVGLSPLDVSRLESRGTGLHWLPLIAALIDEGLLDVNAALQAAKEEEG